MLSRRPRFQRSSDIASLQITKRDLEILRHIARHRFLRSPQLVRLMGGSRQRILRRLNLLYHHGYLERPRCQIDYYYEGGSRSMVYGLGKRGAAVLRRLVERSHFLAGVNPTGPVGRIFLEHTLQVAEFMITLEEACQRHGAVRLLRSDALISMGNVTRDPFRWRVSVNAGEKVGVVPDQAFGLEWTDKLNQTHLAYYFLEVDRGTMPIQRSGLRQASLWRKILAYTSTWSQNLHRSQMRLHRFRVLFATATPERAEGILKACRALSHGQGLFLVTDFSSVRAAPHLLALPWQTPNHRYELLLTA